MATHDNQDSGIITDLRHYVVWLGWGHIATMAVARKKHEDVIAWECLPHLWAFFEGYLPLDSPHNGIVVRNLVIIFASLWASCCKHSSCGDWTHNDAYVTWQCILRKICLYGWPSIYDMFSCGYPWVLSVKGEFFNFHQCSYTIASLIMRQSYTCPSTSEVLLGMWGK